MQLQPCKGEETPACSMANWKTDGSPDLRVPTLPFSCDFFFSSTLIQLAQKCDFQERFGSGDSQLVSHKIQWASDTSVRESWILFTCRLFFFERKVRDFEVFYYWCTIFPSVFKYKHILLLIRNSGSYLPTGLFWNENCHGKAYQIVKLEQLFHPHR